MEEKKESYLIEYAQFISAYKQGQTSGEEVGEVISRMAQYFAEKNLLLAICDEKLTKLAADIVQGEDEATGKAISVSKADILIKATPESAAVKSIKTDLENIEQFINALKYFQKGMLNEYSHMGN